MKYFPCFYLEVHNPLEMYSTYSAASPELKAIEDLRRGQNELFEKMRMFTQQAKEEKHIESQEKSSFSESFSPSMHEEQLSDNVAAIPKVFSLEPVKQVSYNIVHNGSVVVPPSRRNNSLGARLSLIHI